MPRENIPYTGSELDLFGSAVNWKNYSLGALRKYARGRVLEVGAGLGSNIRHLIGPDVSEWTCLEPDASHCLRIRARVAIRELPEIVRILQGTIRNLNDSDRFDAIFYLDVLEHIEDDRAELAVAATHLDQRGTLIVVAPACQWLFSPFDAAIGHFRRYNRSQLSELTPADTSLLQSYYLDSAGALASVANKIILRASSPSRNQIAFWDSVLVPCSKLLDWVIGRRFGKSVVCIWSKQ